MFKNMEGNRVPSVTFRTRRDHEWVDLTSEVGRVFWETSLMAFSTQSVVNLRSNTDSAAYLWGACKIHDIIVNNN